jgi:hypothetical protein
MGMSFAPHKMSLHVQSVRALPRGTKETTEAKFKSVFPQGHVTFGTAQAGGTVHLGLPVARNAASETETTRTSFRKIMDSMSRVASHTSAPAQLKLTVLRHLATTRATYLLQGTSPEVSEPLAQELDDHAAALFATVSNIPPLAGAQRRHLNLPRRFGGYGYTVLARRALPLYLAARVWILGDLQSRNVRPSLYNRGSDATLAYLNIFNARNVASNRIGSVVDLGRLVAGKSGVRKLQGLQDDRRRAQWIKGLSPRDAILVASMAQGGVVEAILSPTFDYDALGRPRLVHSDELVRAMVLSHLVEADLGPLCMGGAFPQDTTCQRVPQNGGATCNAAVTMDLDHTHMCKSGKTPRHQILQGALETIGRQAGFALSHQVTFSVQGRTGKALRADVAVLGLGRPQFVDVTVRSPITQEDLRRAANGAKFDLSIPVRRAATAKYRTYKEAAAHDGVAFVPFVLTSFGMMGVEAKELLRGLAQGWALVSAETAAIRFQEARKFVIASVFAQFARDQIALVRRVERQAALFRVARVGDSE